MSTWKSPFTRWQVFNTAEDRQSLYLEGAAPVDAPVECYAPSMTDMPEPATDPYEVDTP